MHVFVEWRKDGVELPFSLDEGVHMMELMVKSKVYDDVLLTMQRQGRISFYCTNYGEEARLGPWDPMPGGWLEKLFKGSLRGSASLVYSGCPPVHVETGC